MWWNKEISKRMAGVRAQAQSVFRMRTRLRLPPMRTKGSLPEDFGELCRIWELDAADAEKLVQFAKARRREAVLLGFTGIVCGADVLWSLRDRPLMAGVILAVSGIAFIYIIAVKLWQAACVREKRYTLFRAWWLGQTGK